MVCDSSCQQALQANADYVAGGCTIITLIISVFQIVKHLTHYTNPHFQKRIIIIISMAPFYSLMSFATIEFQDTRGYFGLVRDIYEAILIYAFFNLLALYLAYDADQKELQYDRIYEALETKGVTEHIFPMNYILRPILLISRIRAEWYFRQSRLFILQYLAIKPLTSLFLLIDTYIDNGSYVSWAFEGIAFISVFFSVYYLVLFYKILHKELAFTKPLLKFLSVKGVLFFTFWQDFVVSIFQNQILENFQPLDSDQKQLIINECENMLVCFEMVILTIMTTIAFSYTNFKESERLTSGFRRAGLVTLTKKLVADVITDGFTTAIKELKELKEPLRDPFKTYRDANVQQNDMLSISMKKDTGMLTEDDLNQFRVDIHERPKIIPGFIPDENYSVEMDNSRDLENKGSKS